MDKLILAVVASGVLAAITIFGAKGRAKPEAVQLTTIDKSLQVLVDSRYEGLPTEHKGIAPYGWIHVVEPPAHWSPSHVGVAFPICPKPDWYPYDTFVGPPVPLTAVNIDPSGYMFTTPEGISVHRDGWVVTKDGRAFRAKEKLNDMGFPQLPEDRGV